MAWFPCSGSALLSRLFDDAAEEPVCVVEVVRTSVSVHYETGDPRVPVLCVGTPEAVRLPNALVADRLPGARPTLVRNGLVEADVSWQVVRWWRPAQLRVLTPPSRVVELVERCIEPVEMTTLPDPLDPAGLIGLGPGLTPAGDDVVAGALVAAHATADPRLPQWQESVRARLTTTTAVSRGMLICALDGYATDELADFVHAVCADPANTLRATRRLLAVGHTSGAALMAGALHVMHTRAERAAA